MTATLIALAIIFTQLSIVAFGGGNSILPEMHRQVVDVHHWMTAQQFSALFALAQAAPGPNLMVVPLVGWHVAGWGGLLVTSIAKFGPSSVITYFVVSLWTRFKDKPWRRIVQAGLVPMTAGLVAASAAVITVASVQGVVLAGIAAVSALVLTRTKIHPLWVLGAGALVGLSGIGQV
ncbi:chromate transporter [Neorhizobium alkalisoli]|uniref:Chromate transporter n=1 Tax=Neorhizobium alkalisoli TaxID=528178 RepID=A0A561QGD5_9HYPH|nr:chromate transporter [Neorhizobium alkalisoli]TWF49437.1 chromate transporter [Neorhizobium alkalisoli]